MPNPPGAIPVDQFEPAAQGSATSGAIPVDQFEPADTSLAEAGRAFAQGAAQGAAGPLGTAYLRAIGQSPEELRQREATHPVAHGLGEATGLVAGGLKTVLTKGATALGAKTLTQRLALEGALFGAQDEVSKRIKEDPNQSVGSAVAHTALSGLIGGGLGMAATPVNKLAEGPSARFLKDFRDRLVNHMESNVSDKAVGVGAKTADVLVNKVLSKVSGAAIGAKIGHATGVPMGGKIGAILGAEHLDKIMPTVGRALFQNELSIGGFKAATDYARAIVKGETLINRAVDSMFKEGSTNLSDFLTSPKEAEKLEKTLNKHDPMQLSSKVDELGYYMPDHAITLGSTISRATELLKSLKPSTEKESMIGPDRTPNQVEVGAYQRALSIANKPLVVLKHMKDGTLTPADAHTLNTLYPGLTSRLRDQITAGIVEHISKGNKIPYSLALSLSLFLGQPLESSMLPYNMLSNNPPSLTPSAPNGRPIAQGGALRASQPNVNPGLSEPKAKGLNKLSTANALPGQARESSKQGNK